MPENRPTTTEVLSRLQDVYGPGTPVGESTLRWWLGGARCDTGIALWFNTAPPAPGAPCVVWVTRPGEDEPERCPIETMAHLDAFLALVSVARRSPAPVHGNVCPGED